jgi:hypothetical protein
LDVENNPGRTDASGIGRDRLAARFRGMSDEDLTTLSAFTIAAKMHPTERPHG